MVWIGSVRSEKFKQDIVAQTFALIAPVWRVLHQVSCSSKTVPKYTRTERNAPKHEFRVQWCGSGAFVLKILTRHRCTNFCISCTRLARFAPSFVQLQNCSKMHPNGEKRTQT